MSKTASQRSIFTANRLVDGTVVFLDFEGAWNEDIAEAVVARSPDELRALEERGIYDATRNIIVEPYLVEVREIGGRIEPIRYRERVRAGGPTILDDVPGYMSPFPCPRSSRGEGQGEGRPQPATPISAPFPASGERERVTEAA